MISPFESSREHLYAELARLDLVIQREVWRWRQVSSPQPQSGDEFRGLYVSEAEIDAILDHVYPGSPKVVDQSAIQSGEESFGDVLGRVTAEIDQRKAATLERGIPLRLEQLRVMFGLTPFDVDAFLICLAPEMELKYERLYAYLQDDVTRKRPGLAMILNLLCGSPDERVTARRRFLPDAPLLRHGLITLFGDPAQSHPPLLAHYVKPNARVVEMLLREVAAVDSAERGELDNRLRDFCQVSYAAVQPTLFLRPDVQEQLAQVVRAGSASEGEASPNSGTMLVLLQGELGTGKRTAADMMCAAWGRPLLVVHVPRVLGQGKDCKTIMRLAVREAYIAGAALYWDNYDALIPAKGQDSTEYSFCREALCDVLEEYPVTSFVPMQDTEQEPDSALLGAPCLIRVTLPRPSYALRRVMWDHFLHEGDRRDDDSDEAMTGPEVLSEWIVAVAGRFRLTGGQIRDAALDAWHRARQRPPGQRSMAIEDLFAASRARTSGQLIDLAKKITPRHGWADMVLPDDQIAQLHEMCDQMRFRPVVLGEWGFDHKLSLGKGLNALFAGPSGTGKTMAAEVIAGDLGLDLYKVDLSTVTSKYVGETEKNLERIFLAARNSNAILFFDEADALFGKRSEVRDAHDRYANVEISYLLQKMEEYDGLVILTSNLSKNMDDAFVRRMHFTVEFPYPESDARRRIWAITFPDEAPLSPDIDFDLLAERYRLTGGNIRNIALTAAFLAARDDGAESPPLDDANGGLIAMDHLLWATRREFQKMGRLADEREFEMR